MLTTDAFRLILPVCVAASLLAAAGQEEAKPFTVSQDTSRVRCPEESEGITRVRTPVLLSHDQRYRAYAEIEAELFKPDAQWAGNELFCKNTSKLFVAGPDNYDYRLVYFLPSVGHADGNGFELIDWSPDGKRLLFRIHRWGYGQDLDNGYDFALYRADLRSLMIEDEDDYNEHFSEHFKKSCHVWVSPVGFSPESVIVLSAADAEMGVGAECSKEESLWLFDTSGHKLTPLRKDHKVRHYGRFVVPDSWK
jgi:hypothetical protein